MVYRERSAGKYLFRIPDGLSPVFVMVSGRIPGHRADEDKGKSVPVQAWWGPLDSKK